MPYAMNTSRSGTDSEKTSMNHSNFLSALKQVKSRLHQGSIEEAQINELSD